MAKKQKRTENTDKKQNEKPWLFKKGESGNPAGRPLGSKNFETDFLAAVADIAETDKITRQEAMKILIKKAFAEAKEGNFKFYKDIHDRIYGKASESIDLTTAGQPLEINIDDAKAERIIKRYFDRRRKGKLL